MSDDIRSILERLSAVEEDKVTPVNVKHGLNTQQKGVPQLPALFKPKSASPVLTSKKDPAHPMDGYMVGDSVEPKKSALEEAMQEVEEDMLSKVKKDLTQYLDRLEQKVRVDRELKDKAKDEVQDKNPTKPGRQKGFDPEEVDEDPTEQETTTDPVAVPVINPTLPETHTVKTIAFEDGTSYDILGDDASGYEVRHRGRSLSSRFKNPDEADMAVNLFRALKQRQQQPQQSNQDYIEER
jgi:hypothetical protein